MDTDPNLLVFRKFGWLRDCVLLDKQDDLQHLERDLREHVEGEDNPMRLKSRAVDQEYPDSRDEIIAQIDEKLKEYGRGRVRLK